MADLLQFTDRPLMRPDKQEPEQRIHNMQEIYDVFERIRAEEQAGRCSQCGIPFCQVHCPLGNHIPDWLMLAANGRLREAYQISARTNNFPEVCGRICPQDKLCEGSCVIEQAGFGTVTIGQIESFLTEHAFAMGWVEPIAVAPDNGFSVGIIGAGPAGLSAAEELRMLGYAVTVYDRYDRIGGLMIYGIPPFKLEKYVIARREERLREAGIHFELQCEVGRDIAFDLLRQQHDAVLIATGVYAAHRLDIPGSDLPGLIPALSFLTASNRCDLGDGPVPPVLNAIDKHVVVIGGGDTAMDCLRTSVRQGAASVTCLYRRDRANMPGSARETQHAEEEGVRFEWLAAPIALHGAQRVEQLQAVRMELGPPDASGRHAPTPIAGSEFTLKADLVIAALGFAAEDLPAAFAAPDLARSRHGTIQTDMRQLTTSLPGVFAAGDIARGASLVVWAIKDGRDAAAAIHRYCLESSSIPLRSTAHETHPL